MTCQAPLQRGIPPENGRPVRGFSQDERRVGVLTVRRRRLTACGGQPSGSIQQVVEWFEVYGAVAPTPGERFFLALPYLNAEHFQRCIALFSQAFPDRLNPLLLDNSGAHTAHQRTSPENVRLVYLPPYGPELNPIERVWPDLKEARAWLHLPTLEAQQDSLAMLLQAYEAATRQALTSDTYVVEAIHALHS